MEPVYFTGVVVPNSVDVESLSPTILDICKQCIKGWSVVGGDVKFSKISGGISNHLVKVEPPADSGLLPVAFKIFGDKTELLIDRDAERDILKDVSRAGFGPKVLAFFENGRIEDYLTCYTLQPKDMTSPEYVPRIAKKLRHFHNLRPNLPKHPCLFLVISGWLTLASKLTFDDPIKQRHYDELSFAIMQSEIEQMERACAAVGSPVVFCHNDLLSGNILVPLPEASAEPNPDADLTLIDFEYSAYGYRGFDIGNHFNEYAGFECDYSRYPTTQQQKAFLHHYFYPEELKADPELLDRVVSEINVFSLVSHIYWGVWALLQARYSTVDFDYLGYSALRWNEYRRNKMEVISAAKRHYRIDLDKDWH